MNRKGLVRENAQERQKYIPSRNLDYEMDTPIKLHTPQRTILHMFLTERLLLDQLKFTFNKLFSFEALEDQRLGVYSGSPTS